MRKVLASTTPGDCWMFSVGSVVFVVAPRGSGNGYRTHKRLGAELRGTHILRTAVERRLLSGSGGGGSSRRSRVNALAPLSCVVDVHGCRAAAVALPGIRPTGRKSSTRAILGHLGAVVPWAFSAIRRVGPSSLGGGGGDSTKEINEHADVRSLIEDHLGLDPGDEPDLSVVAGVLSGGSTSKDLKSLKQAKGGWGRNGNTGDVDKSPPAAIVLFPDLLPAEVVPDASAEALASGGAAAAIWGSVDAVRAVLVPQDMLVPVRTVVCLDLSVAEASMAAAAALAADQDGLDQYQYQPVRPMGYEEPGSSSGRNGVGNGSGNRSGNGSGGSGSGARGVDDDNRLFAIGCAGRGGAIESGFGHAYASGFDPSVRAAAEDAKQRRATLLAEATANALECERDSVLITRLPSRGLEICSVKHADSAASGGSDMGGISQYDSATGSTSARPETLWRVGSTRLTVNERASALAGKKISGDVVVLLEAGGLRHGAVRVESQVDEDDPSGASSSVSRGWLQLIWGLRLVLSHSVNRVALS